MGICLVAESVFNRWHTSNLEAVHLGHHQVEQDEIGQLGTHRFQRVDAAGCGHYFVPLVAQNRPDDLQVFGDIIHHQDTRLQSREFHELGWAFGGSAVKAFS